MGGPGLEISEVLPIFTKIDVLKTRFSRFLDLLPVEISGDKKTKFLQSLEHEDDFCTVNR